MAQYGGIGARAQSQMIGKERPVPAYLALGIDREPHERCGQWQRRWIYRETFCSNLWEDEKYFRHARKSIKGAAHKKMASDESMLDENEQPCVGHFRFSRRSRSSRNLAISRSTGSSMFTIARSITTAAQSDSTIVRSSMMVARRAA